MSSEDSTTMENLSIPAENNLRKLDYLDLLESESIHIFREVAGQFERPALLFSGGKDSIVLVHLALKAFRPGKFLFLHLFLLRQYRHRI